jgi:anti-sigma factor RsiW
MPGLGCLWNRLRLERWADGALSAAGTRFVTAHLNRCSTCHAEADRLTRLRTLVRSVALDPAEPDWSGFWPGVRARILSETPRPIRDAWWLPLWKPVWGHPRLAAGGLVVAALAALFVVWPGSNGQVPQASAAPVVVQDVWAPHPAQSVMVYSSPEEDVTVIWVFSSAAEDDES